VLALWRMPQSGDLTLLDLLPNDRVRMEQLMDKYHDLPMDLADASLVALAERLGVRRIFTLDSDFLIYLLSDGSTLDVVP
ncbi:MAG: type II toxin-antitoxin system VapC family toxin, partial [Candidatus Saccharimonadales bacterium]